MNIRNADTNENAPAITNNIPINIMADTPAFIRGVSPEAPAVFGLLLKKVFSGSPTVVTDHTNIMPMVSKIIENRRKVIPTT